MGLLRDFFVPWRGYVFVLTPFVLLPLPLLVNSQEAACGYGVLLMAVYWVTECIPISATALLPMIVFPVMGVLPARELAVNYIKDISLMFFGGMMMAVSIENCGLHRRLALGVLTLVGSRPRWILLGFMLPTWFLSMWISNTATTAMMLPVAEAVLQQLGSVKQQGNRDEEIEEKNDENSMKQDGGKVQDPNDVCVEEHHESSAPHVVIEGSWAENKHKQHEQRHLEFGKALSLSIAYAANCGGTGTLTGTPPNAILKGQIDEIYADKGLASPLSFNSYMVFGVPCSALSLLFAWLWLQIFYLGIKSCSCFSKSGAEDADGKVNRLLKEHYRKLGKIRFAEVLNILFFLLLVCLWISRTSEFFTGWGELDIFKTGYLTDSLPALFVSVLLFACPSQLPKMICCKRRNTGEVASVPSLLNWEIVHEKIPWGVLILLGGGFALADAAQKSGLSRLIGEQFSALGGMPSWLMVLIIVTIVAVCTEVTSNTAITTLFLPLLYALSQSLELHPLYLMLPSTVAASFAFMLPVATPPNAIVFSNGRLTVLDMVKAGFVMNILCIFIVVVATHTWGWVYFDLGTPPWDPTNTTSAM